MKSHLLFFYLYFLCIFAFSSANGSLYDSFVQCLAKEKISKNDISKIVYTPNSASFTNILQSYIRNRRFDKANTHKPIIIVTPAAKENSHVSATVRCAKANKILLKIRSGGHDYEGTSYVSVPDFAILDMFNFRSVDVNIADKTAWVGSGAYLGELYYAISQKSKVYGFPAGICPTVGVGGHISGGGYGNMLRKYGLTVDHVIDAVIVDSSGAVLNRSSMGEDLFWAIRGGGGASFGVILTYKINLVPVPETVTVFRVEKFMSANGTAANASEVVYQYQQIVDSKMDKELFIRVLLQPITRNKIKTVRATFIGMFLGNANQLLKITDSIFQKLGLQKSDCQEMPWINSVLVWTNLDKSTSPKVLQNRTSDPVKFLKRKSDYVKTAISIPDLEKIFNKIIDNGKVGLVFNSYGGIMNEVSEYETPFPHRAGNLFKIQYSVNWDEEGEEAETMYINQIRELYKFMEPYVSNNPREAYFNYRDLDIGVNDYGNNAYEQGRIYGTKYFKKDNFDRLVKIKTKVDPDNFFRNEQSIPIIPEKKSRKVKGSH